MLSSPETLIVFTLTAKNSSRHRMARVIRIQTDFLVVRCIIIQGVPRVLIKYAAKYAVNVPWNQFNTFWEPFQAA